MRVTVNSRRDESCMCSYTVNVCGPDESSELELPTELHLAAKYGLSELTTRLLDLPDARYAHAVANCDGRHPEDLARVAQNGSLAAVLENFREVVSRMRFLVL